MKQLEIIQPIVDIIKDVHGVKAIVLGGSWAAGVQRPDSDIDLGVYYAPDDPLDLAHLRAICRELNDFPDPIVSDFGEWGPWVNGGAWLTVKGQRVDLLYRNIDFVASIIENCNRGEIRFDFYQQHPYGFHSYIYCTEIQICKILYDPGAVIPGLKSQVASYPQPLKSRIINAFVWDAAFTLQNARMPAQRGDVYFTSGCTIRIATDLVQALYALNETYFISDKRISSDTDQFKIKPENFYQRIQKLMGNTGCDSQQLVATLQACETLLQEVIALCGDQYQSKY